MTVCKCNWNHINTFLIPPDLFIVFYLHRLTAFRPAYVWLHAWELQTSWIVCYMLYLFLHSHVLLASIFPNNLKKSLIFRLQRKRVKRIPIVLSNHQSEDAGSWQMKVAYTTRGYFCLLASSSSNPIWIFGLVAYLSGYLHMKVSILEDSFARQSMSKIGKQMYL
ncbi:hypothetical protein L2E82_13438 [Cichorium intybus]|uniref:Uncharacterized protein n=1 Tax=Cichorium intybus TaxID=13427 RepID=A0ACB9EXV4_CICIN|nr:hypothetical protein L2E82_13438 [Cichorium intybus]